MRIQLPFSFGGGQEDVYLVYTEGDNPNASRLPTGLVDKTLTYLMNSSQSGGVGRPVGGSGNVSHKVVKRTSVDGVTLITVSWFAKLPISKGVEVTWKYTHGLPRTGVGTTLTEGTLADIDADARAEDRKAARRIAKKSTPILNARGRRFDAYVRAERFRQTGYRAKDVPSKPWAPPWGGKPCTEKIWAWRLQDTSAEAMLTRPSIQGLPPKLLKMFTKHLVTKPRQQARFL